MQILSTARCLQRIEKTASLQPPSLYPLSRRLPSYLSSEAHYPIPCYGGCSIFFLSFALPGPRSLAPFSRGNHPGDRAETHRNYCPTKLINYAGMDLGAEERELFSVALAASAFISSAFFFLSSLSPFFIVNRTGGALSFYLTISLLPICFIRVLSSDESETIFFILPLFFNARRITLKNIALLVFCFRMIFDGRFDRLFYFLTID